MDASAGTARLETAIAGVYGGPLEEFVRRRDALARELRTAKELDAAKAVNALRKPSRTAWALDLGALDAEDALDPLVAAVAQTLDAQRDGGDVRAAFGTLRETVRAFAQRAADAAAAAGHSMDPGVLATAVLAVLGRSESFEQLRRGQLTDIPDAGGLDFLAALPMPSPTAAAPPKSAESTTAAPKKSAEASERRAAAARAAQEAEAALAEARTAAELARAAARDAEAVKRAAEERVRQAEQEADDARARHEHACGEADAAAGALRAAERALAEAQQRVDGGT